MCFNHNRITTEYPPAKLIVKTKMDELNFFFCKPTHELSKQKKHNVTFNCNYSNFHIKLQVTKVTELHNLFTCNYDNAQPYYIGNIY